MTRVLEVDLEAAYAAAWAEWDSSGEKEAWEGVLGAGIR